jgi:pimeloyl-ACP methyl ester carboxylesterase
MPSETEEGPMSQSPVRKAYVTTSAGDIHYRHVPGKGTPIVFFHRTPAPSSSFVPLMAALEGGAPLYAFDTPGFGNSFDPAGMPSIADYASWMRDALDALDLGRSHLFGQHTGALIATELAVLDPARTATLTLNGIPYLTEEEREKFVAILQKPKPLDSDGEVLMDTWKRLLPLFPEFDAELARTELVNALRAQGGRHQAFAALCAYDFPARFERIECPVLAMCPSDDIFAAQFDRVFTARPDAVRVDLGRAGVTSPETQSSEIAAALRVFLVELPQAE